MVFSLIPNVCVLLQKGPPGPPQPQRLRAPPAMMPREVEARPKLNHGLRSEGGVQTVEGRGAEAGKRASLAFTHCPFAAAAAQTLVFSVGSD